MHCSNPGTTHEPDDYRPRADFVPARASTVANRAADLAHTLTVVAALKKAHHAEITRTPDLEAEARVTRVALSFRADEDAAAFFAALIAVCGGALETTAEITEETKQELDLQMRAWLDAAEALVPGAPAQPPTAAN